MNSGSSTEGYTTLVSHISTLISTYPPPFIYIHSPSTPKITSSILRSTLQSLQQPPSAPQESNNPNIRLVYACVNAVACFTPRLFYDTVLNALAGWTPEWDDGCLNWSEPDASDENGVGQRFNDTIDGFLHGLRALRTSLDTEASQANANGKGKGKARAMPGDDAEVRIVLVVERAERLKDNLPDLVVPLTRLAELSQVDITTIFHSELQWDQIRPSLGASPDPFYITIPILSKEAILSRLISSYPQDVSSTSTTSPTSTSMLFDANTYHPALRPLYTHFISTVYSVCSPFTSDPDELAYIAAARWPGFVQPVLDDYKRRKDELKTSRHCHDADSARSAGDEEEDGGGLGMDLDELELTPPTEDTRIRLTRLFTPTLSSALEKLYPRLSSASAWAQSHRPPSNLLSYPPRELPSFLAGTHPNSHSNTSMTLDTPERALEKLPRMAKFILVASFIASTNPAKTDMRMFGRGVEERAKRRRKGGGSPKKMSAKAAAVKIPQRLLGPIAFPLDRMLAILGVLLEENDAEVRPPMPEYTVPGEYTETEISRVAVYAQVTQLSSMHLLHQTSPPDRMELSPTFKCGVPYDAALRLAKDIDVALNDILWEPV